METGLLKMYHENEHFDLYNDLWDNGREPLHMNLTHSLEGILPTSPNHQPQLANDFDCDLENKHIIGSTHEKLLHHQIKLEYDSESEDEYVHRKISITSIDSDELLRCITPAVEIIPIDPDCEYNSPFSNDKCDDDTSSDDDDEEGEEEEEEEEEYEEDEGENNDDEEDCCSDSTIEFSKSEYVIRDEKYDNRIDTNKNHSINEEVDEICDIRLDFSNFISPLKQFRSIETSIKGAKTKIIDKISSYSYIKEDNVLEDDKLGIDIDIKNFDLTTYITEDDCKFPPPTPGRNIKIEKNSPIKMEKIIKCMEMPKRGYKRLTREYVDSDSDESVDVETVSDTSFTGSNVKIEQPVIEIKLPSPIKINNEDCNKDPTWKPLNKLKNVTTPLVANLKSKTTNLRQKVRAILPNPPTTSNSNRTRILNAGAQLSRNKLISVVKNKDGLQIADHDYCSRSIKQNKSNPPRKTIEIQPINPIQDRKKPRLGVGRGKNMSTLIKMDLENRDEVVDSVAPEMKQQHLGNVTDLSNKIEEKSAPNTTPVKEKRKLNLQEYKKRRENGSDSNTVIKETNVLEINDNIILKTDSVISDNPDNIPEVKKLVENIKKENNKIKQPDKNEILTLIAEQNSLNKDYDPILEATKKALRFKKKCKINEPDIVIPTDSIIPLLPLAEITSMAKLGKKGKSLDSYKESTDMAMHANKNYEEIVIVSMGCNTNITLPPNFDMNITNKMLGSSSSLLSNISDTINKVKSSGEHVIITSNSLLSSITNVVLKKSSDTNSHEILKSGIPSSHVSPNIGKSPPNPYSPGKPETASIRMPYHKDLKISNNVKQTALEHGEDKIIMHLRKDRIKPKKFSISIQTEPLPHFSPLRKFEKKIDRNSSNRRNRTYRKRNSSSSSNDDSYRRHRHNSHSRQKSQSPARRHNHSFSRHSMENRIITNSRRRSHNRSYSPDKYRSRSPRNRSRRSRSISKDRNFSKYQRPESRNSIKSTSSTSSGYARSYRGRNRNRSYRSRSSSRSSSCSSRSRSRCSSKNHRSRSNSRTKDRQSSPEERRIVYVGRIEKDTTKEDIKSKFISYGPIRQITFHHKDTGMKYGFVTYERAQDAFKAIDSGGRDPNISMYDISFGGRRAFCRNFYSDLDGAITMNANPCISLLSSNSSNCKISTPKEDSFEALLQKVKEKISAKKPVVKT